MERYEALRRRALGGEAEGWRHGLAVLCHRGVAAWLHAWQANVPATPAPARGSPATPPAPVGTGPVGGGGCVGADELVTVLSCMALAAIGA